MESSEKGLGEHARDDSVTCLDLVRDLAGVIKGLAEDLADDPKHLEGFGE